MHANDSMTPTVPKLSLAGLRKSFTIKGASLPVLTGIDISVASGGFLSVINPDSLKILAAKIEPALAAADAGFSCQFDRTGYFIADAMDHQPGVKPVFNRTVALRDSWVKKGGR